MTRIKPLRRKPDAEAVIASAKAVIRMIIAHPDPDVRREHKTLVVNDMIWKITEARYQKHKLELRSRAALSAKRADLRHEHVFTRQWLINQILTNPTQVDTLVDRYAVACVVTKDEAKELDKVKDRQGWARYRGIDVVRVLDDGSHEPYDLAKAEAERPLP